MNQSIPNSILSEFISRFQLQLPVPANYSSHEQHAAVLIPIICRSEPTLLLTRRSAHLRTHAGQIAFPGGKVDPEESLSCYNRPTRGAGRSRYSTFICQCIGAISPLKSAHGFQVTPIVGLVPANIQFQENKNEVAGLFEMPLHEALSLPRYYSLDISRTGVHHRIYLSWYENQFIWGLTATIIYRLAQQVGS